MKTEQARYFQRQAKHERLLAERSDDDLLSALHRTFALEFDRLAGRGRASR